MNKNKHSFFFIFFFIALASLFAEGNIYKDILEYRYKNDLDLVLIENEAKIVLNNYKSVKINSIFSLGFSSIFNFDLSTDKSKSGFSIQPSISAGLPLYNNLKLTLSSPYSYSNKGDSQSKGLSIGLSGDIYSQNHKKTRQGIDAAYEAVQASEKKLNMRKSLAEKKLLTDIQTILGEYLGLLTKRLSGIQANINYRQVLAQGYAENSTKLRSAKLSLMGSQREEKETEFSFEVSARLFFESCGLNIDKKDEDEFFINLAKSIPEQKLILLENLKEEKYGLIIKAEKDYQKLIEQNKMTLSPFSASGEVGFDYADRKDTIKNPLTGQVSKVTDTSKSLRSGINMLFPGIKLYTGFSFPLKTDAVPSMQVSFSINPLEIYDYYLNKQSAALTEAGKKIELDKIKRNFANEFKTFKIQWEKLEWQQELCTQELGIYKQNAEEHTKWFQRGLINSFENNQANLEYLRALVRLADAHININIFNVRIKELFDL